MTEKRKLLFFVLFLPVVCLWCACGNGGVGILDIPREWLGLSLVPGAVPSLRPFPWVPSVLVLSLSLSLLEISLSE